MTPEEIRMEIERCYDDIKTEKAIIEDLRKQCSHPSSKEVLYADEATGITGARTRNVCDYCGGLV